jgi:hypothetical protein
MSTIRPIKPNEVAEAKVTDFPDAVFEAFNQIIAQNFSSLETTRRMFQPSIGSLPNGSWSTTA